MVKAFNYREISKRGLSIPLGGILLCALLVLLLIPNMVKAQAEKDREMDIIAEELFLFQDIPSVYSASKYEQKVTEAPAYVSIVTAEEIKKYGYRTLADILRSLPGFFTSYDRVYDYLGVRGFQRPGDYNTRVLLLVDGHRTNDNIYNTASISEEFVVDVDLIDRVEVVRGPGSSLYGSNAFFAVINVITRDGREMKGVEVSGEAGTFETYKARLSYGNRYRSGLEVLLSGTYFESEGDDSLFFPEYDDPATNNGIAEDVDDEKYYSFFGEFALGDFTLQGAYNDREKTDPAAQYFTDFNDPRNVQTDGIAYLDLFYYHIFPDDLGLTARINYNYYWYDGDFVYSGVENRDETRGEWLGLEASITKTVFKKHKLILGGEYRNNFRQDQKNFDIIDPPDVFLDDSRSSYFWALFIQDEFEVTRRVTFNIGLRHDHYSTFGGTTNPRLALIWDPLEKTIFKFIYGTAFRAPNAYELYYNDGPDFQAANPDLDPETVDTYEVVYEQFIGTHLRSTLAAYYYEIEDLITLTDHPTLINSDGDPTIWFQNVDKIEAYGFEAELEGKWPSGLEGRISYAYQDNENKTTGQILTFSPRNNAKLNVIVPLLKERLFAGTEILYLSSRDTLAGNETGSYAVANVTLFSQNLLEGLELSGTVYNLFDRTFKDPGSEEHEQDVLEQDGRIFRVKVTYNF